MLSDFLGIGKSRSPYPFEMPQGYSTPGYGDEVAVSGNIPGSERTRARLGMFGNSRSAALSRGRAPDAGIGFGQAPISLMAPDASLEPAGSLPALSAMPGVEPKTPGFFDKGGGWRDALGILGDALAGAAGQAPVYTHMKLQDRERVRQQQQAQISRQQAMQDWVAKQRWERENPAPRAPHYWEMNDGSLGVVGPDGKPTTLFKDPTPKINWIKADNGDGTQSLIPVGPNGPISLEGGDPVSSGGEGGAARPSPSTFEMDVILNRARQSKALSAEDYDLAVGQLGPNGRAKLDEILGAWGTKVSRQVGGKTYYRVGGKWYDNAEGR